MINSLGINKDPKDTKVIVAMSGGVDSSVVAGLMKQEGYDVTGITLKLYDDTKQSKEGRQCCAGQDILDAKRVSSQLNIKHEILYYQKKFKNEVIDSLLIVTLMVKLLFPVYNVIKLSSLETYSNIQKISKPMH